MLEIAHRFFYVKDLCIKWVYCFKSFKAIKPYIQEKGGTKMKRLSMSIMFLVLSLLALGGNAQTALAQEKAPPGGEYKKVSSLVELPDFLPGLGTLYVNPATLPAGPFLAYDREGHLVSTVYMIPLKDINDHKALNNLAVAHGPNVDHVDMYYNAGHPGVPEPHYHVILWYISPEKVAALK
jgi:hypothetical protein